MVPQVTHSVTACMLAGFLSWSWRSQYVPGQVELVRQKQGQIRKLDPITAKHASVQVLQGRARGVKPARRYRRMLTGRQPVGRVNDPAAKGAGNAGRGSFPCNRSTIHPCRFGMSKFMQCQRVQIGHVHVDRKFYQSKRPGHRARCVIIKPFKPDVRTHVQMKDGLHHSSVRRGSRPRTKPKIKRRQRRFRCLRPRVGSSSANQDPNDRQEGERTEKGVSAPPHSAGDSGEIKHC